MKYETIGEIYTKNAEIRELLKLKVLGLTAEQANLRMVNSGWTIAEIVEHIAIVEKGMASICASLLRKSAEENIPNDGNANISDSFIEKTVLLGDRKNRKVEAPERVLPSGTLSIAESFAKMSENDAIIREIRSGLESINTEKVKFPHPFFGDLSATEWLALIGGHEFRHIDQIEEILSNQ
jgi:DinB superfamily